MELVVYLELELAIEAQVFDTYVCFKAVGCIEMRLGMSVDFFHAVLNLVLSFL